MNNIHVFEQHELLDAFQSDEFKYFIDKMNPQNGPIADRTWENNNAAWPIPRNDP